MDRLAFFSRRVVGWSMSAAMTAQLVTDALVMAIWRRGKSDALLGAILPVPMPTFARVYTRTDFLDARTCVQTHATQRPEFSVLNATGNAQPAPTLEQYA